MSTSAVSGPLRTPRLELHVLPLPFLEAVLDDDLDVARQHVPFDVEEDAFSDVPYVLELRRDQLRREPEQLPWLLRGAVHLSSGRFVGHIGFHAPPDERGPVEIGYTVTPAFRRQGYAREMVVAMLDFAAAHGVKEVVASVAPDNIGSQALAKSLGWVKTGEAIDDVDGPEDVLTLALPGG